MTNEVGSNIGLTSTSYCPICNDAIESCLHILRDCKMAKEVWLSCLHDPSMVKHFFQGNLHEWIKDNLSSTVHDGMASGWEERFTAVIWWLWKWRNGNIFNEVAPLHWKLVHLDKIWNEMEVANLHDKSAISMVQQTVAMISWKPPP